MDSHTFESLYSPGFWGAQGVKKNPFSLIRPRNNRGLGQVIRHPRSQTAIIYD